MLREIGSGCDRHPEKFSFQDVTKGSTDPYSRCLSVMESQNGG